MRQNNSSPQMQEDDVIGVLSSTDIAQLLPLGDRILIEVGHLLAFHGKRGGGQNELLHAISECLLAHRLQMYATCQLSMVAVKIDVLHAISDCLLAHRLQM